MDINYSAAMKKLIGACAAASLTAALPAQAVLPIAPFTAPAQLVMPSNIPEISAGTYKKADWLNTSKDRTDTFRADNYIKNVRKRGNIVSFYRIRRNLRTESQKTNRLNRHSKGFGDGLFLPSYSVHILRYDCANDQYSMQGRILHIMDGIYKPNYPFSDGERVIIEGRPYMAVPARHHKDYVFKEAEWMQIRPGSWGASHIDYACNRL